MISTENVSAVTSLTVSETPSSATEPLVATKRISGRGARKREPRHVGQVLARDQLGDAVGMAGHDMAAKLVADLERAFEIEPRALPPAARRGHPQRLGRGIDRKPGAAALLAGLDHGEADAGMQAIEAPSAIEARG